MNPRPARRNGRPARSGPRRRYPRSTWSAPGCGRMGWV